MKTQLSQENPFSTSRRLDHAFVWEHISVLARERGLLEVLDYGAFDNALLQALDESHLLSSGLGVDVNAQVIELGPPEFSPRVSLRAISKREAIPLGSESMDVVTLIGVLEHIHDQKRLLREVHRVLKTGGVLIVAVPGQHLFSFLDLGNLKFRFPRLHRRFYTWRYSMDTYDERYVNSPNGLIGDIESEKRWHEHFSLTYLCSLLQSQGFVVQETDGMGFFHRLIHNIYWISPVFKGSLEALMKRDLRHFDRSELFAVSVKSGVTS